MKIDSINQIQQMVLQAKEQGIDPTQSTKSASNIYSQLGQKYAELNQIDNAEAKKRYEKTDSIVEFGKNLDENDYKRVLDKYKSLDSNVRAHEQAHAAKGDALSLNYSYHAGPDGKLYVNGGSVRFDTSIPDDEASAIHKLSKLANAAGNTDMSGADLAIARNANLNKMLLASKNSEGESYEN